METVFVVKLALFESGVQMHLQTKQIFQVSLSNTVADLCLIKSSKG